MFTKLDIFDFDGTLFDSPSDTPENKLKYERGTGLPWMIDKEMSRKLTQQHGRHIGMRRGWWGRPETLEPPLVPSPAPAEWFHKEVRAAFEASKSNPETLTMILTGRFVGLKDHVYRILHEGKLVKFDVSKSKDKTYYKWADPDVVGYFLGDNGPRPKGNKPAETFPWKVWLIEQFVELHPTIKAVEFWEDRDEHVENFKALHGALVETVTVNHIKF